MSEIDNINNRIDIILKEIYQSKSKYITVLPSTEFFSSGKYADIRFGDIMIGKDLIMSPYPPFRLSDFGLEVCEIHDGWLKYLAYRDESLAKEKVKADNKEQLENKIAELTATNLSLQNRQLKNRVLFSIMGFILGFIAANWKEILIILKIISPPETK